jgi:hypothetical protein
MKFSRLFELQNPKPWHARREFDLLHQAADQTVLAEQPGFEYVRIAEYHFLGVAPERAGGGYGQ